jgi:osmotically-inducible protein OsmY
MAEHEFWRGERPERWRVMAEMEEDRAQRYRAAMSETARKHHGLGDRTMQGVRGPHEGRGPRNWRRSDERILEEISDRLTDDPKLDASEIEVAVAEGEVMLTGRVSDRAARRRAEDIAIAVRGVTHVRNDLRAG